MDGPLTFTSHEVAGWNIPAAPSPVKPPNLADLQRRFNESFSGWPMTWQVWQDVPNTPYGYPAGGLAWSRGGTGTVTDRQGGRDIPFIWSEVDLRGFRVLARYIAQTNPFAIGFLKNLVNYHMRKGFAWQVCRKGTKKTAYPTVPTDDPVVSNAQSALDQWRDHNKWAMLSRELFASWRVDGETGVRHFAQGYRKIPEIRPILPEQIGHPAGDVTSDDSFGFRTPEGDQAGPILAAHIWDMDGGQYKGEWIDADDAQTPFHWIKCNVSRFVKRGRPDFFPIGDMLDNVRELLVNMVGTAIEQAKWAWVEKFPTATADQVANVLIEKNIRGAFGQSGATGSGQSGLPYAAFFANRGGKIRGVEGNRTLEAGPASSPEGWISALQASLRAIGIVWNFPEFFSGDASNNSFASALVAGSPLTVTIEGTQLEWGENLEKPVALKALDLLANAGFLTWEEREQLDIEITEPAVVTPKPAEETQRRSQMNQSKVLSRTTWQLQESLDPQHETANFEAEAKADAKLQQVGGMGGALPGDPGAPPSPPAPDDGDNQPPPGDSTPPGSGDGMPSLGESVRESGPPGPPPHDLHGAISDAGLSRGSPEKGHAVTAAIEHALLGVSLSKEHRDSLWPAGGVSPALQASLGVEGFVCTDSAYQHLAEAGRVGLVKKQIVNKLGKKETVWVKPQQAAVPKQKAANKPPSPANNKAGNGASSVAPASADAAKKMAEQARQIVKKIKPAKERAFTGKAEGSKIDSRLAGAIGEEILIQHLKSLGYADAGQTSEATGTTRNNLPFDLIHDHQLIEAKAGQANNPDGVWALKYDGRFTKDQEAAMEKMKPEDKALFKKEINRQKVAGIHKRKDDFVKSEHKRLGFKVKPGMMTVILNPDTKTADIFKFDGIHDRIPFKSEMAQAGYVRSVKYG